MPVQTAIQLRRGTAASWTSTNPTLAAGEIGFETDTGKFKIGTGSTAWGSLSYFAVDPVTTKGDLYTFSTTDARLAVGSNGDTLVADSAATTGLRYTAGVGLTQPVINGGMDVWQRGTSISIAASNNGYTADRWQTYTGANQAITVSRQSVADSTNLPNIQYCIRYQRNSGQTGTGDLNIGQNIETANSIPLAGKTITLSFYARAGANYSPTSSILKLYAVNGTGTDQNFFNGYTGQSTINNTSHTLTTTWQRFTSTFSVSSSATQVGFYFTMAPTGTASTNDYYEITGVQIDIGSTALPFRRAGGTIQGELAACQRYYYRIGGSSAYEYFASGPADSTTKAVAWVQFPVTMRTNPTTLDYSTLMLQNNGGGTIYSVTSATIYPGTASSKATFGVYATVASGLTQGTIYGLFANNSTSAYVGFSAEL